MAKKSKYMTTFLLNQIYLSYFLLRDEPETLKIIHMSTLTTSNLTIDTISAFSEFWLHPLLPLSFSMSI